MTIIPATANQISYAHLLISKRDWHNSKEHNVVSRVALLNVVFLWINGSIEGNDVTEAIRQREDLKHGEKVNRILEYMQNNGLVEPGKEWLYKPFTKRGASSLIEWLQARPVAHVGAASKVATNVVSAATPQELEAGMYKVGDNFYKVQRAIHGSGNMYAKKLMVDVVQDTGAATVWFEYAPGAIAHIRPEHKMSYEDAKEFGALYGNCCVCGRTLTDELSIALGIGPICGGRQFGGEFKTIVKATKLELKATQ